MSFAPNPLFIEVQDCYDSQDVATMFGSYIPIRCAIRYGYTCSCWFCKSTTHLLREPLYKHHSGCFDSLNVTAIYTAFECSLTFAYETHDEYFKDTNFPTSKPNLIYYKVLPSRDELDLPYIDKKIPIVRPSDPDCLRQTVEDYGDYMIIDGHTFRRHPIVFNDIEDLYRLIVGFPVYTSFTTFPCVYIESLRIAGVSESPDP